MIQVRNSYKHQNESKSDKFQAASTNETLSNLTWILHEFRMYHAWIAYVWGIYSAYIRGHINETTLQIYHWWVANTCAFITHELSMYHLGNAHIAFTLRITYAWFICTNFWTAQNQFCVCSRCTAYVQYVTRMKHWRIVYITNEMRMQHVKPHFYVWIMRNPYAEANVSGLYKCK